MVHHYLRRLKVLVDGNLVFMTKNQKKKYEKLSKSNKILTGKKKRDNQIKIDVIIKKCQANHAYYTVTKNYDRYR